MRRRLIAKLGVAAAVVGLLAGCSAAVPSGNSGDGTTINVLTNFTSDVARGKVLNKLIAEFNKENKGKYTVVSKAQPDWPTLQQQIRSAISAHNTPDVFLYNYNPTDLAREKSGQLMDWSKYIDADPSWKARFQASNLKQLTVGGKLVALPGDQSPALFYYNKTLFAKAGISTFPTTWDEYFADAALLKKKNIPAISLMTADDAWYTMNAFSYLATSAGGPDAFAVGTSLDNPAVATAAADTKKLLSYAPKDALGANYAAASSDFIGGRAATVIDGPWFISTIQGGMKDACSIGVAAAPTFGDGVSQPGSVVTDSLNAWGAAKQTDPKKTAAVVAWMKFFTSNSSAAEMAVQGQYPMAVKTTLTAAEQKSASCQMAEFLKISNAAPTVTVNLERNLTTSAQAKVPSLLEGLALGRTSASALPAALQAANK